MKKTISDGGQRSMGGRSKKWWFVGSKRGFVFFGRAAKSDQPTAKGGRPKNSKSGEGERVKHRRGAITGLSVRRLGASSKEMAGN